MIIPLFLTGCILFAAAIAFLAAEMFVPSHGILAGVCAILALIGVVVFYAASPFVGLAAGVALLIGGPVAFSIWIKYYPRSPVGKRVLLSAPSDHSQVAIDRQKLQELTGKIGVAVTNLRPSGACEINGERIDCVSESTVIDAGTAIEVVRVADMRVIVRERKNVMQSSAEGV